MREIRLGVAEVFPETRVLLQEVLESRQFSPGAKVKRFEEEFARMHDCKYAVMVNSGTDALRIALLAMKERFGWKDGDIVFVPSVTFVATANIVLQCGLKPEFVDVGMHDYNINPWMIERTLKAGFKRKSPTFRAILPVHLFGQPADMPEIMRLAREYDLKVLEDSCETMTATIARQVVGSWGDIGCFSTYMAHILTTGVGGVATTNSRKLMELMRSYANHGRDIAYLPGYSEVPDVSVDFLKRRFRFVRSGYSSRPSEFEAALGLAQIKRIPKMVEARRLNAAKLVDVLRVYPDLVLPVPEFGRTHDYMMFPIVIAQSSDIDKWKLCCFLEKNGIETREMMPLINQPVYKSLIDAEYGYSVAKLINANGFYIPCHHLMTDADIHRIAETFRKFFGG